MSPRSAHTVERLLGSLETLVSEQSSLLALEAWQELPAVQDRAGEVLDRLSDLMSDPAIRVTVPPSIFRRAAELQVRHARLLADLQKRLSSCSHELSALGASQSRMRQVMPAYRSSPNGQATRAFFEQG